MSMETVGSEKPKVLVVDDEPLLGQTIQLGLDDEFSIELASNGKEALDYLFGEQTFDLILCDLSLPDISGAQVYTEVAARAPQYVQRFVVMTGGAFSAELQNFMSGYQGRVLNKPFTLNELEALARELSA